MWRGMRRGHLGKLGVCPTLACCHDPRRDRITRHSLVQPQDCLVNLLHACEQVGPVYVPRIRTGGGIRYLIHHLLDIRCVGHIGRFRLDGFLVLVRHGDFGSDM
ncbi:glutamyl-tRNA(Gln) amidotransferase subunit A [Alternaria sp. MG1]|nr:glutamyl-tRNA(Gln) amidotransferase subunit A [Alternaria sp. MG1]